MRLSPLNKEILNLSIPSIVTNITTPLLGLVDVAIVGHLGSAIYLAAIAVGGNIFNMLYWPFAFLRMGTSGMTAQAYGARDNHAASLTLYRALLVAMLIGLAIIILQRPIFSAVMLLMEADDTTKRLIHTYFSICVWGAPAMLGTYALSGWFLGMQNSRSPMWMSIFVNLLNIVASLLLVFAIRLDIQGVAIGTMIAQWGGFIIGLLLCRRYKLISTSISQLLQRSELRRFFSVNADIFLRTLCLVAVTVWFTAAGSRQGTVILAVNTLLMQLFILFSYIMDGFAFAGEALSGKYYGANDRVNLRRCVIAIMKWGLALAIGFSSLYLVGGQWFLSLLSSDPIVISSSADYHLWAIAIPLAGFGAFAWDAIYIGTTNTRGMLISMVAATTLFFLLYTLIFPSLYNHGLWMAFIAYLITRSLVQTILGHKYLQQ